MRYAIKFILVLLGVLEVALIVMITLLSQGKFNVGATFACMPSIIYFGFVGIVNVVDAKKVMPKLESFVDGGPLIILFAWSAMQSLFFAMWLVH